MAVSTLIVDLDGTVWDSAPWFAGLIEEDPQARVALSRRLRNPASGANAVSVVTGARISRTRFASLCADRIASLPVYEHGIEQLSAAAERVPLGVVTSLPAWIARPMLEGIGVVGMFQAIHTATRGVPPKPSPAGLLRTLGEMEIEAAAALYVGDSNVDRLAASSAGLQFAWASWGYGCVEDADFDLTSWRDIEGLL